MTRDEPPVSPQIKNLSSKDIEKGQKLFSKELKFKIGLKSQQEIPIKNIAEIAFAGRSNVGKSSLINTLTFQKKIARVSKKPGSTRQINFFEIDNLLSLIDLPGYGFAKASKSDQFQWSQLIEDYLINRPSLCRIFLLIDSRRGIKESDKSFMSFLEKFAIVFEIIVTKIDKIDNQSSMNLLTEIEKINSSFTTAFPRVILTSTKNGKGIETLRAEIAKLID